MLPLNAQEVAGVKTDKLYFAELGEKFKKAVITKLEKANEKELLTIDLEAIKSIDPSFSREAFVKLINDLSTEVIRPQLLFLGVNESAKQNLEVSFTYHSKYCLARSTENELVVIGKCPDPFKETIRVMIELKEAKVRDVAKELKIEQMNTVNNRLKELYEMCVISRKEIIQESGGKEFMYFLRT